MAKLSAMTDIDRERVSAAVSTAEGTSAGEIVTILADRSDDYGDVALAWSAAVGFAALLALVLLPDLYLGIYERLSGGWVHEWTPRAVFGVAAFVVSLKFASTWLLMLCARYGSG